MSKNKSNKDNNIDSIIENTFSHIKDIVDANTVIGSVVKLNDNMFVIPVSKISVGLVSGGGVIPKSKKNNNFNAGSGTGFNIVPIGFLAINESLINFLPVNTENLNANLFEMFNKVIDVFSNQNLEKESGDEEE